MREVPCPRAPGEPAQEPIALAVTIDDRLIADICALPIGEMAKLMLDLNLSERDRQIAVQILKEVNARLGFLLDVGRDHPSLDRASATLAGRRGRSASGSATQIGIGPGRRAVCAGRAVDRPAPRGDNWLLETLCRCGTWGKMLIVVEHDEDTIRAADGRSTSAPGRGEHGGWVVVSGPVKELLASEKSLTGAYLSGRASIPCRRPGGRRRRAVRWWSRAPPRISCATSTSRSRSVSAWWRRRRVRFRQVHPGRRRDPVQRAGQGAERCAKRPRQAHPDHRDEAARQGGERRPGAHRRHPCSNCCVATYTGVFDHVRKLFAQTTEAKIRGYQPGRFSFNVKGGRCEACFGDGTIKIEMQFLPTCTGLAEVCPRGAVQHRHPAGARQGQDDRQGPGRAHRGSLACFSSRSRPSTGISRRSSTSASAMSGSGSPLPPCPVVRPSG